VFAIFRHKYTRSLGAIFGWGLSLFLLGLLLMPFYDTIAGNADQFMALFEAYPPELFAFFGGSLDLFTPAGYLTIEYFSYMPLILGIFVVLVGSHLIAGEEESGLLDLIMSHPVSRSAQFYGRLLALLAVLVTILLVSWLGLALPLGWSGMDVTPGQLILPFVSLLALVLVFGTFGLTLGMLLPSGKSAASAAGLALFANFILNALADLDDRLNPVVEKLPFHFYQSGAAIDGLEASSLLALLAFSAVFTLISWLLFLRRDLRVSGEGTWRLPGLVLRRENHG
jgi:ABC-2 type transport system permease protein